MSQIIFYTNPMSRGRIARWMLEEAGVPYKARIIPFGPPMKTDAYRAVNPMGKVPSILHGDAVVTECAAICAYLADAYPEAGLAPRPHERAAYYRWLFFAAGPLEAAVTNRSLAVEIPSERRGMVGYGSYEAVMDTLEAAVSAHPFIAGDRFTAADVYVGSHISWGLKFGSMDDRPTFRDYHARLSARPAYQRAEALDNEAAAELQRNG
ncbi:glutathione S-transferase family protein [Rhizobium sp. PAMB 3182]